MKLESGERELESGPSARVGPLCGGEVGRLEYRKDTSIAMVSLASCSFGVTSLGLVSTLASGGFEFFLCALAFSVFVNYYSAMCFVHFAEERRLKTVSDFSRKVCSRKIQVLNDLFFSLSMAGVLVISLVFMNSFMCQLFRQFISLEALTNPHNLFWLFLCSAFSFPVVLRRQLKDISFVTGLSIVAMTGLFVLILYWLVFKLETPDVFSPVEIERKPHTYSSVIFFTLYILSYQANIIGIYDELRQRSKARMKGILFAHSAVFYLYYCFIAIAGLALFQYDPSLFKKDLLSLFPQQHPLVLLVDVLMVFTSFVSFVTAFKPVKEILIDRLLYPGNAPMSENRDMDKEYFEARNLVFGVTLSLLTAVTFIAGILERSGLDFIKIIDLVALAIAPVVSLIVPIFCFASQTKTNSAWVVLAVTVALYIGGFINRINA